ncbi:MAG: hypothetical protein AzoDbin1_00241 [Azoarcus sp.]|uniref:Uncharacterized protein n=1 Tax=Aromatoleum tolulyticum TaxID=34027 RepID=A0A1N6PEY6_9RHOO|nr:hypothetical protein [Azoarcus sp.]SIQ02955.1 hypothetical protein SAMN05421829_10213 [Aromatoleum tolulyticum]
MACAATNCHASTDNHTISNYRTTMNHCTEAVVTE